MDVTRVGTLVGEDKFGNKYFEDNSYFMPRNRWVVYPEKVRPSIYLSVFLELKLRDSVQVWLDYDATQVPPEWLV